MPFALDGPVERLLDQAALEPESAILESELEMGGIGRFSFACMKPYLTLRSRGPRIEIIRGGKVRVLEGDPFEELGNILKRCETAQIDPCWIPFQGGAAGWLSYDLGRMIERIPSRSVDDLMLPDLKLNFYDTVFAFDRVTGDSFVFASGISDPEFGNNGFDPDGAFSMWTGLAARAFEMPPGRGGKPRASGGFDCPRLRSNFTKDAYKEAVRKARRYIIDGDIFQVNLSQRFEMPFRASAQKLYRRLRSLNPAPFAAFLNFEEARIASSSPERYLKIADGEAEIRPIKGTRPRGATKADDERLAAELLRSAKDRAENTMIVDLVRNDLGRVCTYGSIKVAEHAALETFPTVFHLTSAIRGTLRPGLCAMDAIKASFPDGSITGAPKIRSMEIIEELEPVRRNVYTGAIGYLAFSGDADLNVAIRTVTIRNRRAYFSVGGGITFDSDPEMEYAETLDKGRALARALVSLSQKPALRR